MELTIPGTALVDHFAEREDYHKARAETYRERIKAVGDIPDEDQDDNDSVLSYNPVHSYKGSAEKHEEATKYFALLRKYTATGRNHEVSLHELRQLELCDYTW